MTDKLSPGMRQYLEMKKIHPEAILLFRMGDFYEMFFEDAVKASGLLDIALTSRSKKDEVPIPMCGVPHQAVDAYIDRLTECGLTVAVCEQVEKASAGRGLLDRAITRLETPGVKISASGQTPRQPNFVVALSCDDDGRSWGLAGLEVSTGDMVMGSFDSLDGLRAELSALSPHECLLKESPPEELLELTREMNIYATLLPPEKMSPAAALAGFTELFGPHAVAAWAMESRPEALTAAGAALSYAVACCQGQLKHLAPPRLLWRLPYMGLDEAAIANLELLKTLRHGELDGSLLGLLDRTITPMGGRLLRQWLVRPLLNGGDITNRHGAVEELLRNGLARDEIVRLLKKTGDLERALGRLVLNRGGPRDLAVLRDTLTLLDDFRRVLSGLNSARLAALGDGLPDFSEMTAVLRKSLVDNPPLNAKDGGLIKRGVSAELDELMDLESGGKSGIAALEARERERTGINSLKIGFNRVYGYYLEVTKTNLPLVPNDWIRKQTIAGGERFLTPELKEWEEKILHAGERRLELEEKILDDLKAMAVGRAGDIKTAAQLLSEIDILAAFSDCAERYRWVRPELTDEDLIDIKGGRHPVVEASLPADTPFVANDVRLTTRDRIFIITGPNMAGKSTILRQTALIVLMNQVGSFVPAESARLSMRDRIFTRVGASDDLARGRSTFMVEMNETASILAMASPSSLVVLDEVGRGTSTYDGISLAWAIAEYLHDLDGRGVPTLFATHYHELVDLSKTKPRVKNFNVAVQSAGKHIVFMRKLKEGGASRSHGLTVAAMAGLPKRVIDRAREILSDLSKAGRRR
ncbi:MAG: DNA mismatch repair protein MutS, partial [Candidatus Adiutrix sp.]|nr:DNA mismatch repair protein MutS [Candidatus Adiutrix sp.]